MSDTRHPEGIAEHHFASALSRMGLLIAKPFFDRYGADLLGFIQADNKGVMCRIQAKYRDCRTRSQVEVPVEYTRKAFLLCLYLVTANGDHHAYLLPDQIRKRFTRTTVGSKAVYRLSLTANVAKELGVDDALKLTPEKFLAIKGLMLKSSVLAEMAKDAKKVVASADEVIQGNHNIRRLQELIYEATIAELQVKSANEQIETLEACLALLEKHGLGPNGKKRRTPR
jgi:hypothetical protein